MRNLQSCYFIYLVSWHCFIAYAQDRYKEITGRDAPVRSNEAVPRDQIDKVARLQILQKLGHNWIEITNCYLGSNS